MRSGLHRWRRWLYGRRVWRRWRPVDRRVVGRLLNDDRRGRCLSGHYGVDVVDVRLLVSGPADDEQGVNHSRQISHTCQHYVEQEVYVTALVQEDGHRRKDQREEHFDAYTHWVEIGVASVQSVDTSAQTALQTEINEEPSLSSSAANTRLISMFVNRNQTLNKSMFVIISFDRFFDNTL